MNNTVITALATPYLNGKVHQNSLEKLVHRQNKGKADILLALGTTGENAFLSAKEKQAVWQCVKATSNAPVWVGVDDNCTQNAVKSAKFWQKQGASGLLVSPPSFVKCTSVGYVEHIKAIANAVDIPLMLYNVPSRCGYFIPTDALEEIGNTTSVRWLKDAGNKLRYTQRVSGNFFTLSGNDMLVTQQIKVGAVGCVSVLSNAFPTLARCVMEGNVPLWQKYCKAIYTQISPIGIKYLLFRLGVFASYEMRLPLTKADNLLTKRVDRLLKQTDNTILEG